MKYAPDFWSKLCDPIDSHSYRNLSNHRLIAFHLPTRIAWLPCCGDDASSESTQVRKELRPQVSFCAVVGNEMSDEGVACAWPEANATATVVARLPTHYSIPE